MYSRFAAEPKKPAPDAEDLWNVPACKLPLGYGLYAPGSPTSVAAGEPVRGVLERKADEGLACEHAKEGASGRSLAVRMFSERILLALRTGALLSRSVRVSYVPGPGVLACRSCRALRRAASAWARCAARDECRA
jgi:hypothetical protein